MWIQCYKCFYVLQVLFCLVHPTAYCCIHYFLCSKISSSYTHQVSDCHSNLVTTPSSSIDLTSQSVSHISLSFLCRIFLILDKLKIEMTKDSLHHAGKNGEHFYGENLHNAGKNGEHSCVENFHGDNLNPHNINKPFVPIRAYKRLNILATLSIASFLLDLNIKSPRYMNTSQKGTSSQTNTWTTLMHPATM